jgi:hypothetical protein
MLAIIGTVPDPSFPLTYGTTRLKDGVLHLAGMSVPVGRGTPALAAAAVAASEWLFHGDVFVFLVGDVGRGDGSRVLYRFLAENLFRFSFDVMVFHYLQPDVDWHNKVLFTVDALPRRPVLIADAGFMYAAKMSGQASAYDIFTPDIGEMAFLADERAPHPFYTRGFILHDTLNVPDLVAKAYAHDDAPRLLVVKGETDYIAEAGRIVATVREPICEAMEAIGGTGDTLTGILGALCASGKDPLDACRTAALTNRWVGRLARPTPATQVAELIPAIPDALAQGRNPIRAEDMGE